jgi:cytochrome P450
MVLSHCFAEQQLIQVIMDLYEAGSETTTTTLRWGLAYLLRHPDALERMQAEIDDVLQGRLPTMKDKLKMPFVEATLNEIQRMADVIPFSVPHCTNSDAVFRDYFIPKGTMVIPNLYAIHRHETHFKNPFEFNPLRFLNGDGSCKNIKQLLPFSVGKSTFMMYA